MSTSTSRAATATTINVTERAGVQPIAALNPYQKNVRLLLAARRGGKQVQQMCLVLHAAASAHRSGQQEWFSADARISTCCVCWLCFVVLFLQWCIKAKVTRKGLLRSFNRGGGPETKIFDVELADAMVRECRQDSSCKCCRIAAAVTT
jgi:hypothetical protein